MKMYKCEMKKNHTFLATTVAYNYAPESVQRQSTLALLQHGWNCVLSA